MRDARVVRRLVAGYTPNPDLERAWKRAFGVAQHLDTTISDMEKRLADLRRRRDNVVKPLDEAREMMTRAIRDGDPVDKMVILTLVQQSRRMASGLLDFDERNHLTDQLTELAVMIAKLPEPAQAPSPRTARRLVMAASLTARCRAPVDLSNISRMERSGSKLTIHGRARIFAVSSDGQVYGKPVDPDYKIHVEDDKRVTVECQDPFHRALIWAAAEGLLPDLLAEQRNYLR